MILCDRVKKQHFVVVFNFNIWYVPVNKD